MIVREEKDREKKKKERKRESLPSLVPLGFMMNGLNVIQVGNTFSKLYISLTNYFYERVSETLPDKRR